MDILFLKLIYFLIYFWLRHTACRILVPRPGIEPVPSAVKALSPNHWTAREFPTSFFNVIFFLTYSFPSLFPSSINLSNLLHTFWLKVTHVNN